MSFLKTTAEQQMENIAGNLWLVLPFFFSKTEEEKESIYLSLYVTS
jgi:hypothetical protein